MSADTHVPVQDDPLEDYDPGVPEPVQEEPESRLSPIELGAERTVLSSILTTPRVFDDLCDQLTPEDFGNPAHEAIYAAIVACDVSGRPFDTVTVADEMNRAGTLHVRGRGDYLQQLVSNPAALHSLDAHVDIVKDRSLRRRMVHAARVIGTSALDPQHDSTSALNTAEQVVFELGRGQAQSSAVSMAEVIAKTQAEMARARTSKIVGLSTGIDQLDEVTGGLRPGQLVIVAGRPSMGKSVLALQIALHIAEVENREVGFYSYEMQHQELGQRMLAARSGISLSELSRGYVPSEAGLDRVFAEASQQLSQLPLTVDEQPPPTIGGLRSEIRRLARRKPLTAVVVDYLQLLTADGRRTDNRTQEVAEISRSLKMLAVELEIPIIAVSQLSRQLESRPNKRPIMSDLRESGSLEQDANIILALYREWVYDRTAEETHSELLVIKNRQGPLRDIPVDFDGPCARFRNTDRELDHGGPRGGGGGHGGPVGYVPPF